VVKIETWRKWRKPFIVLAFVIGAIIAPDWMTQILIAVPLLVLYEVALRFNEWMAKKRERKSL
jgi:sec-independent protein translocase protein TatC